MEEQDFQINGSSASNSLVLSIGSINTAAANLGSIFAPNSPIMTFGASIRQVVEVADNLFSAQRAAMEVVESWSRQYKQLIEGMARLASLTIPMLPTTTLPVATEGREVLEGEVVKPEAVEVSYQPEILVSAFGIGVTADERFYDKVQDKGLDPLNIGSTSGKFLMLLITSNYHYVTHEKLDAVMRKSGYHGGRRQLRQDLRKLLKRHDLDIETRRTTNRGITLIGIKRT